MPWISYPYNHDRILEFKKKFKIQQIPTLVVMTKRGSVLTMEGRRDVIEVGEDVVL